MVTTEGSCRRRSQIKKVCCAIGSTGEDYRAFKGRMMVADAALGRMIASPSMMVGPVVSLVPMQKSTCYDEGKHTSAAAVAAEGTEELVRLHANDLDLAVVVFLARSWNVESKAMDSYRSAYRLGYLSRGSSFGLAQSQKACPWKESLDDSRESEVEVIMAKGTLLVKR